MKASGSWVIIRVDGKIAAVSPDWRRLPYVAAAVAKLPSGSVDSISGEKVSTRQLFSLAETVRWEDFHLFGTKFQTGVWKALFDTQKRLYSYSEFASICGNPKGVRSVAHAVGLNPVACLIPCHRIVPKETIDRVQEIRRGAESTLFRGSDLYLLDTIDVGEYEYGPALKRDLIKLDLGK